MEEWQQDEGEVVVLNKRQRRPSVRLGEIGDYKNWTTESLSSVRWISPAFLPGLRHVKRTKRGRLAVPRTRTLANVGGNGVGAAEPSAVGDGEAQYKGVDPGCGRDAMDLSMSGCREDFEVSLYAKTKAKQGTRKRGSMRLSNVEKTFEMMTLKRRQAKEMLLAGSNLVPTCSNFFTSEVEHEAVGRSGGGGEDEVHSGLLRTPSNHEHNERDRDENGEEENLRESTGEEATVRTAEGVVAGEVRVRGGTSDTYVAEVREIHGTGVGNSAQAVGDGADAGQTANQLNDISKPVMVGNDSGVKNWLAALGLSKYARHFFDNEVDDDVLPLLTFDDLREMGISAVGARRKLFAAIQQLTMI